MASKKEMKSGAELRAFRRKLASTSDSPPEKSIRTLKFPLVDTGFFDDPGNFDAAHRMYDITEGISEVSLYSYLMHLHLGGFRAYSSASRASSFRNRSQFGNQEFRDAISAKFTISCTNLDIEAIYGDLSRPRRTTARGPKLLSGREIADNYYQLATGKKPDHEKDHFNEPFHEFLSEFGRDIERKFSDWGEVNQDVASGNSKALGFLDQLMSCHDMPIPSVAKRIAALKQPNPPNSAIAFDLSKERVVSFPLEVAIHIVVAQYLQDLKGTEPTKTETVKYLQSSITTDSHNALSWLFGAGLSYFRSQGPAKIMSDLETGDSEAVNTFISVAKNIPEVPFGHDPNYSAYRRTFGGKIDSWIANYATRLYELDEAILSVVGDFTLPDKLAGEDSAELFGGMSVNFDELSELISGLYDRRSDAADGFRRLFGRDKNLPTLHDVETIERFSEELDEVAGQVSMLRNRLEQELKQAKAAKNKDRERFISSCTFSMPGWLKKLPKLNRISGGVPNYPSELSQSAEDFNTVRNEMARHFQRVKDYCKGNGIEFDVLGKLEQREQDHIDRFSTQRVNSLIHETASVRAHRNLLHRIARVGVNCGPTTQGHIKSLLTECKVLKSRKDLNRLFNNNQGAIYRSLFSTSRHEPFEMIEENLNDSGYLLRLEELVNQMKKAGAGLPFLDQGDALKVERLYYLIMLGGLPDGLPREIALLKLPSHLINITPALKGKLEQELVRAETVIKVFNHYHSLLNGLFAKLVRTEFILRTKFTRVGDTSLFYQPKDKQWPVPDRYRLTDKPVGGVINSALIAGLLDDNMLDVRPALAELSQSLQGSWAKDTREGELTPYLIQAPHDWKYELGYGATTDNKEPGFRCDKKKCHGYKKEHGGLVRLIGPSSFKGWLDRAMLTDGAEIGDMTLIIDQRMRQEVVQAPAGLEIKLSDDGGSINLACPLTEKFPKGQPEFFLDRFVAIDLGEVGIGYAVYEADSFDLLESGSIPIRSIRNLMSAVNRHRKAKQPQQKFQASYSPQLAQMRANAIGDTLGVVDGLMEQFNAFPIFESSVGNFERGANQLKIIYESVLKNYIFSNIDAHKAARKHHWCGGERWSHPVLQAWELTETGERTGKTKPLNLFPGASVHPAGTSQTCSKCKRNPIKQIYEALDRDKRYSFTANDRLEYALPSGDSMHLFRPPKLSDTDQKIGRRQKLNRLPTAKLSEKFIGEDMLRVTRQCLRFRQESMRSKDTSQSRYRCLFSDCGHEMHADENAAINIGYKWFTEKLVP